MQAGGSTSSPRLNYSSDRSEESERGERAERRAADDLPDSRQFKHLAQLSTVGTLCVHGARRRSITRRRSKEDAGNLQ
ncbi:hypothetical protein EYF80_039997 [Liparis tanakae]|uniref:Uncharacterized protein n=1 Tax=Liparis tanakae TaxID=230148 RepID=A0A4Z2GA05_9TELE|nr:hypothetical protein EYF80_039997 [Liparis tanakae]